MVRRIRNISELKDSGFGRPQPRHGLRLLFWFAKRCISVSDDEMYLQCDPAFEDFGFHYFENRSNEYNVRLLKDGNFPYYVVGNLNSPGASMLPDYVVKDYNRCHDDYSNTDRIIVSIHEGQKFGKVYVTTHIDQSNYDPHATFHVTRGLLMTIRSYRYLKRFLKDAGYHTQSEAETSNQPVYPVSWWKDLLDAGYGTQCKTERSNQPVSPVSLWNYSTDCNLLDTPHHTQCQADPSNQTVSPVSLWNYSKEQNLLDTGYYTQCWLDTSNQPVSPVSLWNYSLESNIDIESTPTSNSSDFILQLESCTPSESDSENLTREKGFWERFCTIL